MNKKLVNYFIHLKLTISNIFKIKTNIFSLTISPINGILPNGILIPNFLKNHKVFIYYLVIP